jgi:hypothetical protein
MCEKLRQEFDTVAKETIAYRQRNLPRSRKKLNRQPKQKNRQPQIIYEIFVEFTVSNNSPALTKEATAPTKLQLYDINVQTVAQNVNTVMFE